MDKILYTFNQYYFDLLSHVKKVDDENGAIRKILKQKYKIKDKLTRDHIEFVSEQLTDDIMCAVVNSDETKLFEDANILNVKIFNNVSLQQLIDLIKDENFLKVFFYLFATLITVYNNESDSDDTENEKLLLVVMDIVSDIESSIDISEKIENLLDEDIKTLVTRYQSVYTKSNVKPQYSKESDQINTGFAQEILNTIENTQMGSLAKELTQELDMSGFDAENLDLNNITKNPAAFTNIISQVGSKIQEKLENGDLNQNKLVEEAFSMLNVFNKSGMINNPLMSQMMKLGKNKKAAVNTGALKNMSARERLRQKYIQKQQSSS